MYTALCGHKDWQLQAMLVVGCQQGKGSTVGTEHYAGSVALGSIAVHIGKSYPIVVQAGRQGSVTMGVGGDTLCVACCCALVYGLVGATLVAIL